MNTFRKAVALLLSVCLLASMSFALAEDAGQNVTDVATDEVTEAVADTAPYWPIPTSSPLSTAAT
jgi:hypothetical protein